jgi:hypothetical protein
MIYLEKMLDKNYIVIIFLLKFIYIKKRKLIEVADQIFQNNNGVFIIIIQLDHGSTHTTN